VYGVHYMKTGLFSASCSPSKLSTSSHHGSPGPGSTQTSRTGSPLPPKASASTGAPVVGINQVQDPSGNLDTIPLDSPDQPDGNQRYNYIINF